MIPTPEFAKVVAQEIMFLFEEKFIGIQEQILALRRFTVGNRFRDYTNDVINTLQNYHSNAQITFGTTTQQFQEAFRNASDCYTLVLTQFLLVGETIAQQQNPERVFYDVQVEWKAYFDQRGIVLPQPLAVADPPEEV